MGHLADRARRLPRPAPAARGEGWGEGKSLGMNDGLARRFFRTHQERLLSPALSSTGGGGEGVRRGNSREPTNGQRPPAHAERCALPTRASVLDCWRSGLYEAPCPLTVICVHSWFHFFPWKLRACSFAGWLRLRNRRPRFQNCNLWLFLVFISPSSQTASSGV